VNETKNNNNPVAVTGEERSHPSLRLLARACIELARQQLDAKSDKELRAPTKEHKTLSNADSAEGARG
jgi:hypothetical protein